MKGKIFFNTPACVKVGRFALFLSGKTRTFPLIWHVKPQLMMRKLASLCMALLCMASLSLAQRTITGTITDQKGRALAGASILVQGTEVGALSDREGGYILAAPQGMGTLLVSLTGYESQVVLLGTSDVVDVKLIKGIALETDVATALDIRRDERELGYSVGVIGGSDLSGVRDPNFLNLLAGRAAGLAVVGSSGNLGGSTRLTLRGIRSLSGNNQPLFVVDGIPMDNANFTSADQARGAGGYDYGNAIQDLNPDDIASVNVLKGQAAVALYGMRGANGAIVVETKKGGRRKGVGLSFQTGMSVETIAFSPAYQNAYGGGADLRPVGFADSSGYYRIPFVQFNSAGDTVAVWQSFDLAPFYGLDESFGTAFATSSQEHFDHLSGLDFGNGQPRYDFFNGFNIDEDYLMFRDWNSWDEWDAANYGQARRWEGSSGNPLDFYQTGATYHNSLAFEGGTERSAFRLSFNRLDQKGILPNSKLARNTVSFNGSMDLSPRVQAFLGVHYVGNQAQGRPGTGYDRSTGRNVAQMFNQWWHRHLRIADLASYQNPDGTQRSWNRVGPFDPAPQYWDNPYWTVNNNYQNDARNRLFGNAGFTFKPLSWLSLTGRLLSDSYTERREERIAVGSVSQSFYSEDVYGVQETNADLILRIDKSFGKHLTVAAFAGGNKRWSSVNRTYGATQGGLVVPGLYRLQNSADRPFIANSLDRQEINSLFGGLNLAFRNILYLDLSGRNDWSSALPAAQNGYLYPAASLGFVFSEYIDSDFFSFGKIRAGWASVGNEADPYSLSQSYLPGESFGSLTGYSVSDILRNSSLMPETTTTMEAGLDLHFFKNRLGIDVTYYKSSTINQLIPVGLSPTTGYLSRFINAGEVANEGVEAIVDIALIRTGFFNWDMSLNGAMNRNTIVELNADDPSLTALTLASAPFSVTLCACEGQPYGTIMGYDFLYDPDGNRLVGPDGFYLRTPEPVPLGSILPKFTGGISNTFQFGGLTVSALADFRIGGDIFSLTNVWGRSSGLLQETAADNVRETGIIAPGAGNEVVISAEDHFRLNGGYIIGAADVYDGSFVKLREARIGYTFPRKMTGRLGIQELSVAAVGRNLAMLYKNIPHIDPDGAVSAGNIQGLEGGQGFSARSVGVVLSFQF